MRFGPKSAEPRILTATHAVVPKQGLKIERQPVRREGHGVVVIGWVEGLLRLVLVLGWRLRESVDEVVVGIEGGGVVVPDGRHDGYVAVVRGVVGGSYTC